MASSWRTLVIMEVDTTDRLTILKNGGLLNGEEFDDLVLISAEEVTKNVIKVYKDDKKLAEQLKKVLKNKGLNQPGNT